MNTKILKNIGIVIGICFVVVIMPRAINADFANTTNASYVARVCNEGQKSIVPTIGSNSYYFADQPSWLRTLKVVVTAYSSTPDQTDDTPFITASGKYVQDGIIANNMLPFGTKVKIPGLYGDKIFIVEDRMASYKSNYHIDIWMPSYTQAVNFGVKTVDIEVLES